MKARLARALRAIADRLAGQPELDALRLDNRRLTSDLATLDRKFQAECAYVEGLLAAKEEAERQGVFWLRTAGDLSEAFIRRDAAQARQSPQPSQPVVVPFGRRNRPDHLRSVD